MRYGDVVQFDPIETVVQLRDADDTAEARDLVASYVISEEMAERLETTVFSQLQFDEPADQKGVLVVGNYGTGKSHLMSLISAVAEHADLADVISNPKVVEDSARVAGRFKVVRTEIGAVTMDFREFVCSQLEEALLGWGIDYRFPARDEIPNHKIAFDDMMAAFEEDFPDHGLLLVVDELLDYLRTRRDQELILDLNFLREIGEICKGSRFRFVAGVQEAIFDSPRFQFAADTLLRVKDRFEQFLIARRDVKFVVGQRLLKKTAEQEARVREHLTPFASSYGNMNERMDEFVRLFPIHPDYIDTFERISVVEKREVLKSLSQAMRRVLDDDVPSDAPSLISYDSYWDMLRENPAFRAIPSVREVIDVGTKLEERVEIAFPNPAFKPLALRLVRALGVHRLTVGDVYSEVGATAYELRDTLCVYDPAVAELGGDPAEDLAGQILVVLKKARDTVDGTYVGFNRENDQFYLRVTDEPDPDTLIEKRVETLEEDSLNRYYFDALKRVMELADRTVVTGYRIWPHELTWRERNAPRSGYLFFGAPNERSTAQPPRDFYLYFLQPYGAPSFKDEKKADEVFFRLKGMDASFGEPLAKYAASLDLAATASGQTRSIYESKANGYLRELVKWLREHMAVAFDVTHGGRTRPILEWVKGKHAATADTVREMVDNVASACLATYFEDQAPEYPRFSVRITGTNLEGAVREALRAIAGGKPTRQATAVLDALELLDGDRLDPRQSRYANHVLELFGKKGQGQVTNRDELLRRTPTGEYLAPDRYRLEPEWLVVLLASLVYSGNLVLAIQGKKLTVNDLDVLAATPLEDLTNFKHIERPKTADLPALTALFELVGLAPGLAKEAVNGKDESVARLQAEAAKLVQRLVLARNTLESGLSFWGRNLFSEAEVEEHRTSLERLKSFLETLQAYATPAKLKNFRNGEDEVRSYRADLENLKRVEALRDALGEIGPPAAYLSTAQTALPEDHPLFGKIRDARERALGRLESLTSPATRGELLGELGALKSDYIQTYMALHTRARLGLSDDRRKSELLYGDERLKRLETLSAIELLPVQQLKDFKTRLANLRTCYSITSRTLESSPLCQEPNCNFKPALEDSKAPAKTILSEAEKELDGLQDEWVKTLLADLEDPSTRENLPLISQNHRKLVEDFLVSRTLPEPLTQEFVSAVREALASLRKVTIRGEELRTALLDGGSPATPDEMRKRFERFLDNRIQDADPGRVRIVLE